MALLRLSNRRNVRGIFLVVAAVLGTACGGGSATEDRSAGEPAPTSAPTVEVRSEAGSTTLDTSSTVDGSSTTLARPTPPASTTPTTARKVRPVPGPPSPAFFPQPVEYYNRLKALDPAQCAALARDLAFIDERTPDSEYSYEQFATFVFRGAARGCSGQSTLARADLSCATFIQLQVSRARDPKVDEILVWALENYGPAPGACRHPSVLPPTSTSSTIRGPTTTIRPSTTTSR